MKRSSERRSPCSSGQTKLSASPMALRAAGAADAMDVVLVGHREVVIDDVRDAVHVDAARGDVGGHEDADLALP